jgi:hypothetical protein
MIIGQNLRNSEELASAIKEYISFHPESVAAMKMFAKICFYTEKADNESFPVYEEDFFSYCEIDSQFYNDKFTKRIYNLIELMNSVPHNKYPVTYNMIKFIGKTVANRVFEVCNDEEGFKDVQAGMKILDIIRDVYLRIYTSGQKCLVPLFAYAIIQLCGCENIFIVRNKSFYDKVRTVEIDHKRLNLSLSEFPHLN